MQSSLRSRIRIDRTTLAKRSARGFPVASVPEALSVEIDANGSPITVQAATWLICFVPGLRRQWWHRFADSRHKHVFALRPLDDGTWLLVEPWWTRMMVNVLTLDEAVKFLRWGGTGDILKVREAIPGRGSQMRGWANCSVLVSFLLGRSYWTWTPNGLYRKLLSEPDVESVDVGRFLRDHFLTEANRHASPALKAASVHQRGCLGDALLELGTGIVVAMTSASAIGLHKAAISECNRFCAAAEAFWASAPARAVEHVRKVLVEARRRREIEVEDCEAAARRFVAMLRGNLHLEVTLGLRSSPSLSEVRDHVTLVVDVFLRGAKPAEPGHGHDMPPARTTAAGPRAGVSSVAQGLIREIGESVREVVSGDDWEAVSGWAEVLWSGYVNCTGLTWEQASGRVRQAWESCGAAR